MEAGIVPDGPEDAVFDIVEREPLALNREEILVPRTGREPTGRYVDVANAPDRVVIEHQTNRHGVVQVDPVRKLLRAVVSGDGQASQTGDVAFERPTVGRRDHGVANPVDLAKN